MTHFDIRQPIIILLWHKMLFYFDSVDLLLSPSRATLKRERRGQVEAGTVGKCNQFVEKIYIENHFRCQGAGQLL